MAIASKPQSAELSAFTERLRQVGDEARKLLAQVADLAYSESKPERETDTAYVPEILESCGLDVDHMYELVRELREAKLISVENQYPFEKVKLELPEAVKRLRDSAKGQKVSLREFLVKADFNALQ